jgi:hypothetical protein
MLIFHNKEKYGLMRSQSPTSSVMPKSQIGTELPMALRKKMHLLFICLTNQFDLKELG